MSNFEAPMTLELTAEGATETLVVETLMREIPGRRFSGQGQWRGRKVFCKVFVAVDRVAKHAARECAGSAALVEREFATARLLHEGPVAGPDLPAKARTVLYEWIDEAENLDHLMRSNPTESRALGLLRRMADLIGRHHKSGIVQRDLHFANFALAKDELHTFDAGSIEVRSGAVTKASALDNLAIFFAQMDPGWDSSIPMLLDAYSDSAGSELRPELEKLWPRITKERRRRMERFLDKVVRPCRLTEQYGEKSQKVLISRPDDGAELRALVARILAAEVLRDGLSLAYQGETLRLRVYEQEAGKLWKQDPARQAWRNAQRLGLEGLPTPAPLAVCWQAGASWFLSRHAVGSSLESAVSDPEVDLDRIADGLAHFLQRLDQLGLRHGQMSKRAFIRLPDDQVAITNLEELHDRPARPLGASAQTTTDMNQLLEAWAGSTLATKLLGTLQQRGYGLDLF